MPEKEYFQVIYDGVALSSGEMDIRDLAPALLAISDALDESNKIVYGDKTRVQVNVKGSFKTGSFHIDFSVVQCGLQGFTSLFNSDEINAASNLLQILGLFGIPGTGLIGLLIWLRNRKIKGVSGEHDGKVTIEVEDDSIETSTKVIALFSNVKVRTSLQKIISEPLSKDGIETFSVKKDDHVITIRNEEKEYFRLSDIPDEPLEDQVRDVYLKALSVNFVEGNKWRFSDGTNEFFAIVKDHSFVKDVQESKITFTKDDTFKVRLRERQWISDTGLKPNMK